MGAIVTNKAEYGTKVRAIRRGDEEYPRLLEEISSPPALMYAVGGRLEPAPCIAVVGSRKPSRYGLEIASWMARGLAAAGILVVSGLAKGIDAAAHRGALQASASTVAVLGNGIDVCYPWMNRDLYFEISRRGTLLSEYEAGTPALRQNFPTRNRIIAGMSLGVVIVEGRIGGGAMITARLAMEFGREVFAVAGPVHSEVSEGPHSLVRDGARLVTSPKDVLEDLGIQAPLDHSGSSLVESPTPGERVIESLTPDERTILSGLEAAPVVLDLVADQARMPASTAAATLCLLELKGLVVRHAGGRFSLSARLSQEQHRQH